MSEHSGTRRTKPWPARPGGPRLRRGVGVAAGLGLVAAGLGATAGPVQAARAGATRIIAGRDPAVVRIDAGPVRGTVTDDHRSFKGIPYAAPPVGGLRWAPPQPAAPWTTVRNATRPGADCPQTAGLLGDAPSDNEDCLYLNVTTPPNSDGRRLPVMFWIHGGGFFSGSGRLYGPERMAATENVVVVTLNYRLGVFGFLAHPSLDGPGDRLSGDFGLQDQQAALRWVHRNAAAFGGDPRNVTLFGESAGGVSTCSHLASPASAGLFERAIIQSGPCALTTQWPYLDGNWVDRPRATAESQGMTVAAKLGCADPASAAACLRAKPVSALLDASDGGQGFGPAIGGGVLPVSPATALATGRFNRVPVIQGTTRDEHRMFVAAVELLSGHQVTDAEYPTELAGFFGREKAARVLARYPLRAYGSASLALSAVWTDYTWGCTALGTDRLLSRYVPTYAYEFDDQNAPWAAATPAPSFPTGAFHSGEVQYLFDDEQFPGPRTDAQRRLSDQLIRYWARFARTGSPNGGGTPDWARFDGGAGRVQALAPGSGGIRPVDLGREHQCGFWQSLDR
jgi:para-nitrobenzyl esterase